MSKNKPKEKDNFNLEEVSEISLTDTNVVITIPIKALIVSQEKRIFMPFRITDEEKMLAWIKKNIFRFYDDPEFEYTGWSNFIDSLFDEAYDTAEGWLEGIIK